MPTYEYVCNSCGQRIERIQPMSAPPLRECEQCGGELRKVFSPVGIVFKGSGFYKTDSRGSSRPSSTTEQPAATRKDDTSGADSSTDKTATPSEKAAPAGASSTPASTPATGGDS